MSRIPFISRSRVDPQPSTEATPGKKARQAALHHAVIEMLEERRLMSVGLISVNSAGVAGNGASDEASTSSDGTYVAFSSFSTNLGGAVQNGIENIYLRDAQTGTTTLVSAGLDGAAANGNSDSPKVSANGQVVVFASDATNLVPNDTSTITNIFAWNMATDTITRVTVTPNGGNPNGFSEGATISADGSTVAFSSYATNIALTPAISTQHDNVYLDDLSTGKITLVSVDAAGTDGGNGASFDPKISGSGSFVTFRSTATNLENSIPIANPGGFNIYIRNIAAGTTSLVSVDAAGTASGNGNSISASLSDNGEYVLFRSSATDLVANDTSTQDQVYLRNTVTNTTTLLSADDTRTGAANGFSEYPYISDDGRYAAFSSTATDLVANDSNTNEQVYVRDLQDGPIYLISVDDKTGLPANGASYHTYESTNGNYVTFTSAATDLTPTPNNGVTQVYIATAPAAGGGTTTGNGTGPTTGASGETTPPTATIPADQLSPTVGATTYQFTVDLADAVALNTVSLGNLIVSSPLGMQTADYVSEVGSGPSAVATYQITFSSPLSTADNDVYAVLVPAGAITNAAGIDLTAGQTPPVSIGSFTLTVPPATAPDLVGSFAGKLPLSVIGGKKGSATVVVTNVGVNPIVKKSISFALYVSEATTLLPGAAPVRVVTQKLSLKHGKSTKVKFNFTYPNSSSINGQYYLVAQLDSTDMLLETNRANSTVATPKTITIAPPFKALNAISVVPTTTSLAPGGKAVAVITVQNAGNVPASGRLTIDLTAPTGAGDITGTGQAIAAIVSKINIKAGGTAKLKIKYAVSPSVTAESGFLSATIDPSNVFKNPDQNDNIATSTIGIAIT